MLITLATQGLFNRFDLSTVLGKCTEDVGLAVEGLDADLLLGSSTEDLSAAITSKLDVLPPDVLWGQAEQLPTTETKVDVSKDHRYGVFDRSKPSMVPATRITIAVPVTGDVTMLGGRATTFKPGMSLDISVVERELRVSHVWINPEPQDIKAWWERQRQEITQQVTWIQADIQRWRDGLPDQVRRLVEARRARLLRDRGLEGSLGLKVRVRDAGPQPVPVRRKKVATTRALKPVAGSAAFRPEPELEERTYHEVLDIICAFGRGLERSPRVAQKYDEEELRDQIIVQLNGHFEGEASGELFNGAGKTDILIRQDDRNVFIGECKFWEGQSKFTDAINQLGSYMVWRDTKSAIVLFIKQKNPSAAVEKAQAAIRSHPRYKRDGYESPDPTAYTNYILRHGDDHQREIRLALIPIIIRPKPDESDINT